MAWGLAHFPPFPPPHLKPCLSVRGMDSGRGFYLRTWVQGLLSRQPGRYNCIAIMSPGCMAGVIHGWVVGLSLLVVGLSLLCSKIFFWELPPKTTYYSHNFILLFSNYSHNVKSHVRQKKACSMHKVHSKGNFKCSQHFFCENIRPAAAEEGLPLDTVRDSLGNAFIMTAAHEAPVPKNKIFSFYLRLFLVLSSHYYYAGILGSGLMGGTVCFFLRFLL